MSRNINTDEARNRLRELVTDARGDLCVACGSCVAGCPIADWDEQRLDPRRAVRLVQYGIGELLPESDWIWHCTNCGRCGYVCPMGINQGEIIARARALVPPSETPGNIQATADLHRTTSNNMQLTEQDWLEVVEWMADELREEIPDLEVPMDRAGADLFVTINSKLPQYYPMDLQSIFKIFHTAGVSWTLSSQWWEGTNYAYFTQDLATWEETLRRQAARVEELGCPEMSYTECGHGYYATLAGYARFGIEPAFSVTHQVSLYARWIREGRFRLDPSRNPERITIHDPCNAVRKAAMAGFPDIADDLRFVLRHVAEDLVEMTPNREANYCCSGGGGALLAGFKRARLQYGRTKVDQVDRTEADWVCTPCVNCFDSLSNLARDFERPWRPIHLWTLLANAIVLSPAA